MVYDPFAGSGTTLVEAAKLGAIVAGRDINPVATLAQRQALREWSPDRLTSAFDEISHRCASRANSLYITECNKTVLYYFWVNYVPCVLCGVDVDLFSNLTFARHAYPQRNPAAHAVCPECGEVVSFNYPRKRRLSCTDCGFSFSLKGAVESKSQSRVMQCRMGHSSTVLEAIKAGGLRQRMFAKLVVADDGSRQYSRITEFDEELFQRAGRLLRRHKAQLVQPTGDLTHGVNTVQAQRWGLKSWGDFFNQRQLYTLGLTAAAIRDLRGCPIEREVLCGVFLKALEFNNMFASYKGEGTGAVRPIFHNHALRPERVFVEANLWAEKRISGSIRASYARTDRIRSYRSCPRDLVPNSNDEVVPVSGLSTPINGRISASIDAFARKSGSVLIATGDAANSELPDNSVDLIITDPPYAGKVNYSELADFFHAWLRVLKPYKGYPVRWSTTRRPQEVQTLDMERFQLRLLDVWKDARRVLRHRGLLAFTFHGDDPGPWRAIMSSLSEVGFTVTGIQPVTAEMVTSVSKARIRNPTHLDMIIVCRKVKTSQPWAKSSQDALRKTTDALRRLDKSAITYSQSDSRALLYANVFSLLTCKMPRWDLHAVDTIADELVNSELVLKSY